MVKECQSDRLEILVWVSLGFFFGNKVRCLLNVMINQVGKEVIGSGYDDVPRRDGYKRTIN